MGDRDLVIWLHEPVSGGFWQHLWRGGITELGPSVGQGFAGGQSRWRGTPGRFGRSGGHVFLHHSAVAVVLRPLALVEPRAAA